MNMTNTAAAIIFPLLPVFGHNASHGDGGELGFWGWFILAAFAVVMLTSMWFLMTDKGNAAWATITKRFRKATR